MSITIRDLDQGAGRAARPGTPQLAGGGGSFVCVGDEIHVDEEDTCLRGHGTLQVDGKLVATLCGVVERVNKLILVRPLKTRYEAAQGDVVVGRVTEVAGKRWKVGLGSRQEAHLLLSAVNLPGGVQRRRNADDELRMREVLREGDLLSAEVQAVHTDGMVALHTRSSKYGKLVGGLLVAVPPSLVKRQKQHFHTVGESGTHLILGCNGLVWVAPQPSKGYGEGEEAAGAPPAAPPSKEELEAVVLVASAIHALATCYLPIYPAAIDLALEVASSQAVSPSAMREPPYLLALVAAEAARRDMLMQTG